MKNIFSQKKKSRPLDPDEIFLDSSNIPDYDTNQFEGRIEKPISNRAFSLLAVFFVFLIGVVAVRAGTLDIGQFAYYNQRSINNTLEKNLEFAPRGIIADRNGTALAWNTPSQATSSDDMFPLRQYTSDDGFSNLLGFVKYPKKDSSGNYYSVDTTGQDGIEKYYDDELKGVNGVHLTEKDAQGNIVSQSAVEEPEQGKTITLSIDAGAQKALYDSIKAAADKSGFIGGAGVIMDAQTGEVLAMASYPEYSSQVMTDGSDSATINSYMTNPGKPFLNQVISGLFAPGSTAKPYLALGALNEGIIDPSKKILSTGQLVVPNPYNPSKPNIFKDWKVNGWTDMRQALAVSSDVYFYELGGGFGNEQQGLGITRIDKYFSDFLFGVPTSGFLAGPTGNISSPAWKAKVFGTDPWVLGDTYHTAIGQYGTQVTPLQLARALTGIVNNGTIVDPVILKGEVGKKTELPQIPASDYEVVKEGMRLAVTNGTAIALNIPQVEVAAKTGTAQVGANNELVHSWVEGFFPYDNPRYTFALVLEKGPTTYQVSAMRAMSGAVSWIANNKPEYIGKAPVAATN